MKRIETGKFLILLLQLLVCLGLAVQVILFLGLWTEQYKIDGSNIKPDRGFAYLAQLPDAVVPFPLRISSDGSGTPANSNLIVYEDGHRLGPAHSVHDQIRLAGEGAYSHWNGGLFFSSSDGSDPRTNGRAYTAVASIQPNAAVLIVSALAAVGLCMFRWREHVVWFRQNHRTIVFYGTVTFYLIASVVFFLIRKQWSGGVPPHDIRKALFMTVVNMAFSAVGEHFDIFALREKAPSIVRRFTYLACGLLAVAAGALSIGLLPAVNVGSAGFEPMMVPQAKPSGLATAIILHALGGLVVALIPFFAGSGAIAWTKFGRTLSLHGLILAGYPVGLGLLATGAISDLALPHGWTLSVVIFVFSALGWRRSPIDFGLLKRYVTLTAVLCPFGLLYALWIGLDWHGPFSGAGGLASGDLSFYSNSVWSLHAYGLPLPNLGLEGERFAQAGAPNMLMSMIGAAFIDIIPLDPYLFLTSTTTMTYAVGVGILLTAFMSDSRHPPVTPAVRIAIIIAVVAAGRYPYWIAESPPVAHAILLAVSLFWYRERSAGNALGVIATLTGGLVGSAVSKIVAVSFFACLSLSPFGGGDRNQFSIPKPLLLLGSLVVGLYIAFMLATYGSMFLSIGRFGPESYRYYWSINANILDAWPYVSRDIGVLLLEVLCLWLLPLPLTASVAFISFIAYSYLFQINMLLAVVSIALLFVTKPDVFRRAPILWTGALALLLPAMLFTDPSGITTAAIWIAVAVGVTCSSMAFAASAGPSLRHISTTWRLSCCTAGIVALLVVAVEDKHLSVATHPVSIPYDAMEIWSQVRSTTDPDTLVFTDQTSPNDIGIISGWNSVAVSGTRQVYVSNWVQSSLRSNSEAKIRRYETNDAVLSGRIRPDAVNLSRLYKSFAAVVRSDHIMPAGWSRRGANSGWTLYVWNG